MASKRLMSTPIICTRSPRALKLPNVRDFFWRRRRCLFGKVGGGARWGIFGGVIFLRLCPTFFSSYSHKTCHALLHLYFINSMPSTNFQKTFSENIAPQKTKCNNWLQFNEKITIQSQRNFPNLNPIKTGVINGICCSTQNRTK